MSDACECQGRVIGYTCGCGCSLSSVWGSLPCLRHAGILHRAWYALNWASISFFVVLVSVIVGSSFARIEDTLAMTLVFGTYCVSWIGIFTLICWAARKDVMKDG